MYKAFFRPCKYSHIYLLYHLFVEPYQVCMAVFINATCISQVCTVSYPQDVKCAWNMKDRKLYQGATIKSWGLLMYGGRFSGNEMDRFKNCLQRAV